MKKIILIFTVLFTFLFSSVGFASCNLDLNRWEWLTSNDDFGVFIDTQTIKYSNNFAEVWECFYYPNSCELHPNVGEHYHYSLYSINYSRNTMGAKAYVDRDSRGNVLATGSYSYVEYRPIAPDSIGEGVAIAVRKRLARR